MKKKVRQNVVSVFILISISLLPLSVFGQGNVPPMQGKQQLVDALDASFIRILSSGKWREITKPLGPLALNIADCYPTPDAAPFPENPTGLLAAILNSKKIRVGTYPTSEPGSYDVYTQANQQILRAMLDELGKAYNLSGPIEVVLVNINPPSGNLLFTALNDGTIDITDLNSALGGVSLDQRRRKIARFTCTVISSGWFLHVRDNSSYQSIEDLQADPNAKLCSGILSTQLGQDYFPNQNITPIVSNDVEQCSQGVVDGIYDAFLHFDPKPAKTGLRSIDTGIVSGVPFWVAGGPDENSNTTSTVPEKLCPLSIALSNKDQLDKLRELRDIRLKNTTGIDLVSLYYANAQEVSQILAKIAVLREMLGILVTENVTSVDGLLLKGQVTVSKTLVNRVTSYLNELKANGSPRLQADIDAVLKGIRDRSLLRGIGVTVEQ